MKASSIWVGCCGRSPSHFGPFGGVNSSATSTVSVAARTRCGRSDRRARRARARSMTRGANRLTAKHWLDVRALDRRCSRFLINAHQSGSQRLRVLNSGLSTQGRPNASSVCSFVMFCERAPRDLLSLEMVVEAELSHGTPRAGPTSRTSSAGRCPSSNGERSRCASHHQLPSSKSKRKASRAETMRPAEGSGKCAVHTSVSVSQ